MKMAKARMEGPRKMAGVTQSQLHSFMPKVNGNQLSLNTDKNHLSKPWGDAPCRAHGTLPDCYVTAEIQGDSAVVLCYFPRKNFNLWNFIT